MIEVSRSLGSFRRLWGLRRILRKGKRPKDTVSTSAKKINVILRMVISLVVALCGQFDRWNTNGGDIERRVVVLLRV